MKTTFGEYISQLRTAKGLTLTQLASRLDLDSANLSKIENDKREFDEKRLEKLASIFNLNIDELKSEYFGEQFTIKMFQHNCTHESLIVAEQKINYLKCANLKHVEIKF